MDKKYSQLPVSTLFVVTRNESDQIENLLQNFHKADWDNRDIAVFEFRNRPINIMGSITKEEYWDKHWEKTIFEIAPKNHPLRQWIEKEIPSTTTASCIEIGCYPGKFLSIFGEKGYELNGIDLFSGVSSLSDWLKNRGYRCGDFYEADFINFAPATSYDLVCSFGFIEHFKNWSEILDKHLKLLKSGGKIIIDVPNLNSPAYYYFYKLFEPKVIESHVSSSMDLGAIKSELIKKGCQINYAGYIGYFYFRFVTKHSIFYGGLSVLINLLRPLLHLFPESVYKRYIGIIATKM